MTSNLKTPQKILILKNRALGDAVMGLGGVQYLRSLYPSAKIIYGVPSWVAPIFKNTKGAFDAILPINLKTGAEWINFYGEILNLAPDYIYEMFQSGRSGTFFKLYNWVKKVPYEFHNHHLGSVKNANIKDHGLIKSNIQRDLDGLYGIFGQKEAVPHYLSFPPELKTARTQKLNRIIFGVVATRSTKMWPLSYYVQLAHMFKNYEIVIPLSKSIQDLKIKEDLLKLRPPTNFNMIHLDLSEVPAYFSSSLAYIGNDTGLKHIAAAVGLPTWTFFGPEPPLEWHPYELERHQYFFTTPLECRTKTAHFCGLHECDSMICLNNFSAAHVFEKVSSSLITEGKRVF